MANLPKIQIKTILAIALALMLVSSATAILHSQTNHQTPDKTTLHQQHQTSTNTSFPSQQSLPSQAQFTQPQKENENNFELPNLKTPKPTIVVPDDYATIQTALDNAVEGDVIFVKAGNYETSVTINKPVWLVGENQQTFIDAHSKNPNIHITHDNVNITGFTMINTPTPATGSWIEQRQGIGLPVRLENIIIEKANNCNIYGNILDSSLCAVHITDGTDNRVFDNVITNNARGVAVENSKTNLIANNTFQGGIGIVLKNANNNQIISNIIDNATCAMSLDSASNNIFVNNTLTNNFRNLAITGSELADFVNHMDESNTIDNRPIIYWIGKTNQTVPENAANIILVNSTNITIKNTELAVSRYGIVLANTNNSLIKQNTQEKINPVLLERYHTPEFALEILLFQCNNNQISHNTATVWLNNSSNNQLVHNTGVIRLSNSDSNHIKENHITNTGFVPLDWSGLRISSSSNNLVENNEIFGNSAGIYLIEDSKNNYITNNSIYQNAQGGIVIGKPTQATVIYQNTITDNGNQGILDSGYNTTITANNIIANRGRGLEVRDTINSTIKGNIIEGFKLGGMGDANINCVVVGNNISINSRYGQYNIWIQNSHPATFYHNNFLSAISFHNSPNITHTWDNGAKEGNYWHYYTTTDTDNNITGKEPYKINEFNTDKYPILNPVDITQKTPKPPTP